MKIIVGYPDYKIDERGNIYNKQYNSVQLAKMFNVAPETIRAIINGINWKEEELCV